MKPLILTILLCGLYVGAHAQAPAEIRQSTAPTLGAAAQEVQQAPATGPGLRQKTAPALGAAASPVSQPPAGGTESRITTQPSLPGPIRESDPRN